MILFARAERGRVLRRLGVATWAGPAALALRRLRHDRVALAYAFLFVVLLLAFLAAPLYASRVAGTTPEDNHLTDAIVIDGKREFVVSEEGVPIGPTWQAEFFLGADENGRDLKIGRASCRERV